jgi:hypothetical protein
MDCPWIGLRMMILGRRPSIRDAMEEDFLRDKMIARQKSEGKRELLNLQSSINYGKVVSFGGFCGLFCGPLDFFPWVFVWVPLRVVFGCVFWILGFRICGFCWVVVTLVG